MKSASWQCLQTSALMVERSAVLAMSVGLKLFTGSMLQGKVLNDVQDVHAVLQRWRGLQVGADRASAQQVVRRWQTSAT